MEKTVRAPETHRAGERSAHGRGRVRGARALSVPGFTGRTAWARSIPTPLREFLRTETGGAAVLLAAAAAALVWVNADPGSYERVWTTRLAVHPRPLGVALHPPG